LGEETRQKPFLRAHIEKLEDILPSKDDKEYEALADACKDTSFSLEKQKKTIYLFCLYTFLGYLCINKPS